MNIEDDILIQKYEMLLYNKELIYFDAEEFEVIISHYVSNERYADALEALIHAELCHPEDLELALHKIRIMMYLDNHDRAFELLLALENKACDFFEINLYKGHIYTINDEIENAVREFELVFEKNPDLGMEDLQYIPEVLIEQKYFEEALIFLHRLIDSGKTCAKIFFNTGFCYDQLSNVEEAEKYYEKSLDEDPFNEKTWVSLGVMHHNANNTDKAVEAFDYALSINSKSIASLCKTIVLMESGKCDKAVETILEVLDELPGDANALCNLGECYENEDNQEEAEQCYIKAIGENSDFVMPFWNLSKLLYAQGNIEAAIRFIDKAIAIEPDNEDFLYFRGQCFISLSRNKNMLETVLHNPAIIRELNPEKFQDSEFINKHKKAVFFYNIGEVEDCCKYLLESLMINSEALELFFKAFPKAKDDAYIINYFGKYLK
ncbi:MAG: tetratricopeptide repeat protein [Prevotellaceae bacterium]|jgi:tetratricopeptide (TPR) repeat protein|nr:tetratricopeptide repeat protein [Prevotellaceae bacterium]